MNTERQSGPVTVKPIGFGMFSVDFGTHHICSASHEKTAKLKAAELNDFYRKTEAAELAKYLRRMLALLEETKHNLNAHVFVKEAREVLGRSQA